MRLPRLPQKRPIGRIIERIAKEAAGPQAGHTYLYQNSLSVQLQKNRLPDDSVIALPWPGTTPINYFVVDESEVDGPDIIG